MISYHAYKVHAPPMLLTRASDGVRRKRSLQWKENRSVSVEITNRAWRNAISTVR